MKDTIDLYDINIYLASDGILSLSAYRLTEYAKGTSVNDTSKYHPLAILSDGKNHDAVACHLKSEDWEEDD